MQRRLRHERETGRAIPHDGERRLDEGSAGYLGGEPRHDVERRLDELHRRLQQQRHAQAAGADARDGQPDDPDDGADDGDEDGEEREGQAEQEPERPAAVVVVAVAAAATAAHLPPILLPFPGCVRLVRGTRREAGQIGAGGCRRRASLKMYSEASTVISLFFPSRSRQKILFPITLVM